MATILRRNFIRYPNIVIAPSEMDKRSTDEGRDTTLDVKNVVRSLAKGFRILQAFKPDEAEMTLSQIAARTSLDSGTTFRLINTLVSLGYVARVSGTRRYRLGLKVLDLGFSTIVFPATSAGKIFITLR